MIVYGTKDTQLGLLSVGNLRNMPNSEIQEMKDAKHAAYEERPAEWHRLLFNFLLAVGHV
jgi:abhydrolase domain-containing protein 14